MRLMRNSPNTIVAADVVEGDDTDRAHVSEHRDVMTPRDLRTLRRLLHLTQQQAAKRFGVRGNTWSRWELGNMTMRPRRAPRLRRALTDAKRRRKAQLVADRERRQR